MDPVSHHQSVSSLSCVSFGPRCVETFDLLQIPVACFCAPRTATIYKALFGEAVQAPTNPFFSRYHCLHPGYWYLVPAAVTARSHLSVESHFFLLSCTLQHPPDTSMPPNASPHPSLPVVRAPRLGHSHYYPLLIQAWLTMKRLALCGICPRP